MGINRETKLYNKWWVLIGVSIASFMGCIDFTIVNTALPAIGKDLHADVEELQWIINIFALALSSFMVIMGRVADTYGRRKILYTGVLVFGFASLFAGCVNTIHWLIVWRLIQGISCAILYTASNAIVANAFPVEERGRALGVFFGISFTGLASGPVLGGLIVGFLGWRWVFWVNVPVAILSILLCIMHVRESKNETISSKIDYLGAFLLMFGIASLVITITQGNSWGWLSQKTIFTLLIALLLLSILYYVEEKSDSPIIKFSLFINRGFISSIVATFFLAFFYCVAFFLMPLYLQNIRGESDYMVGLMLLPATSLVAILSPIVGKYVDRRGPKKPLILAFMLFAISAMIQANFNIDTHLMTVLSAFILVGVAWGLIVGPATVLSISSLPRSSEALAVGMSWTLHNIGGSLGLSLGVAVYNWQFAKHNSSFIAGYQGAMVLLICTSLFSLAILSWNFRKSIVGVKAI